MGALGRIARHVTSQDRMPLGEPRRPDGIDVEAAAAIIEHALQARPEGTMLPLQAAEGLLRAYGVSVSAGRAVTSEDAAVAAANEELGYPVALEGQRHRPPRPLGAGRGGARPPRRGRGPAGVAGDHGGARRRGDGRGRRAGDGAARRRAARRRRAAPPPRPRAHLRPGRGPGRRHRRSRPPPRAVRHRRRGGGHRGVARRSRAGRRPPGERGRHRPPGAGRLAGRRSPGARPAGDQPGPRLRRRGPGWWM